MPASSNMIKPASVMLFAAVLLCHVCTYQAKLKVGFYNGKCGDVDVENIIFRTLVERYRRDRTIAPAFIRMQFHDCFVRGCDASLLLDGPDTERTAAANKGVRGYDVIDLMKTRLERVCPGVVSCADILNIAARDSVALTRGPWYEVPTGRRDGKISHVKNVDLPGPSIEIDDSIAKFKKKGLDVTDMVVLLGAHTLGSTNCSVIYDRLYNFSSTGHPDPTMSRGLATLLRRFRCPRWDPNSNNKVHLDISPFSSDNNYYKQILQNRGVLRVDQNLALHSKTRPIVMSLASDNGRLFLNLFGRAMAKMGSIKVLTGQHGEIRKTCSAINKK